MPENKKTIPMALLILRQKTSQKIPSTWLALLHVVLKRYLDKNNWEPMVQKLQAVFIQSSVET